MIVSNGLLSSEIMNKRLFSDKERFLIADWTIDMITAKLKLCEIEYNKKLNYVQHNPDIPKETYKVLSMGPSEKIGELMSLILFNGTDEQRRALWKIINLARGIDYDGKEQ